MALTKQRQGHSPGSRTGSLGTSLGVGLVFSGLFLFLALLRLFLWPLCWWVLCLLGSHQCILRVRDAFPPSPSLPLPLLETRTWCPGTAAWLQGSCFGCRPSSVIGLASAALLLLGARAFGASCSPHCRWPYWHPATRPPTVPSCRLSCHPPRLPHLRAGKQGELLQQC